MKLADLKATSETFAPLHPSFGDAGVVLEVCSPFSREYNNNTARIHGQIFGDKSELEDSIKWDIYQAEAVVTGWTGIDDLEYSDENKAELFRNPEYYWLVLQVGEWLSKKKGYIQTIQNRLKHM